MLQFTRSLVAVCALTVLGSAALAQEMVDNPNYKSWAKFKPGTRVTLLLEDPTMKHETTSTLVDLTAEKAVVEVAWTNLPSPTTRVETKAQKCEIPAKVKKEDAYGPGMLPPREKGETKELADEDVTVAGKMYKCKVYQVTKEEQELREKGVTLRISASLCRSWICPQVPGELVKAETIVYVRKDTPESRVTTTLTAVDVK